jgi:hypothetical protein
MPSAVEGCALSIANGRRKGVQSDVCGYDGARNWEGTVQSAVPMFLASMLVVATPAVANNDRVQRAPAPEWVVPSDLMPVPEDAGGLVFVRRSDTLVHLDDRGQATYLGYRIRILHPNALQVGNVTIAWNPAA